MPRRTPTLTTALANSLLLGIGAAVVTPMSGALSIESKLSEDMRIFVSVKSPGTEALFNI
jgi:hypothetical protein